MHRHGLFSKGEDTFIDKYISQGFQQGLHWESHEMLVCQMEASFGTLPQLAKMSYGEIAIWNKLSSQV